MSILEHEDAIKEYYEQVKDKYPNIDFEKFRKICKSPFEFIKKCIRSNDMPKIMIKYIGKFRIFPGRIKKALKSNDLYLEREIITPEYHQEKKGIYENYLNDLLNKNNLKSFELIDDEVNENNENE